jgi:methanol--5-hydroxybenzimidazolylcobamide Co-methyltransferase
MVLAEMHYIPRVFAAIVRIATVVRGLVAVEEGATGPDKDCGYEGVFLKAIAGIPVSMEGKTAACAHLSPVGNVAAACADLWSNESVQNIKLLGGMAPTVYTEQLEYDCRLMNEAIAAGPEAALQLRDLFTRSDVRHDPQALILAPANVIAISEAVVGGAGYLEATVKGCLKGLDIIEDAIKNGELRCPDRESVWLERIRRDLESIPDDEGRFIDEMLPVLDATAFIPEEYGL